MSICNKKCEILFLATDSQRKTQLEKKYREYCHRMQRLELLDPQLSHPEVKRAWYKQVILGELLRTGRVCRDHLFEKVSKGADWHVRCFFDSSFRIIVDYNETGGEHLKSGTGLPDAE